MPITATAHQLKQVRTNEPVKGNGRFPKSNEGWQVPNMREMIKRIGSLRPARFAIADITSRFFQIALDSHCGQYTVLIKFRGIYEWTRVSHAITPIG